MSTSRLRRILYEEGELFVDFPVRKRKDIVENYNGVQFGFLQNIKLKQKTASEEKVKSETKESMPDIPVAFLSRLKVKYLKEAYDAQVLLQAKGVPSDFNLEYL